MLVSLKAESFVGIIVGVFILSFVMLGIINILIFSTDMTNQYNQTNRIQVLEQNIKNVIKKIDSTGLQEGEEFYLRKNSSTPNTYEILTGSTNQDFQYIDKLGENILDINTFDGDIYLQKLFVEYEDNETLNGNKVIKVNIERFIPQ